MSQNGRLPPEDLAPIALGQLRKDCAAAWNAMNVEARSLGIELLPTGSKSSYRSYAQQVELYALYQSGRGNLAAVPGTSNHGWGTAVDVATQAMRAMIDRIGSKYGWSKQWSDAPSEWWHILYQAGHYSGPDPGPWAEAKDEPTKEYDLRLAIGYNADGRVQLASLDSHGDVFFQWMQQDGKWSGWRKQNRGGADPFVSLQFARHPDGHLEVFAKTAKDITWRIHQNGPNGTWASQFVKA